MANKNSFEQQRHDVGNLHKIHKIIPPHYMSSGSLLWSPLRIFLFILLFIPNKSYFVVPFTLSLRHVEHYYSLTDDKLTLSVRTFALLWASGTHHRPINIIFMFHLEAPFVPVGTHKYATNRVNGIWLVWRHNWFNWLSIPTKRTHTHTRNLGTKNTKTPTRQTRTQ